MVEQLICNQQVGGSSPSTSSILRIIFNMGEFPSGQREQTVNLSSLTSVVRIHSLPPKNRLAFASLFFYPLRKQWHIIKGDLSPLYLISPSGLYIITPLGVYQKCFRNDDIQRLAPLMISTALPWWYAIPCRIDYIQCFALISTKICVTVLLKRKWYYA